MIPVDCTKCRCADRIGNLDEAVRVVADFGIGKALVAASAATGLMFTQVGVTVGTLSHCPFVAEFQPNRTV